MVDGRIWAQLYNRITTTWVAHTTILGITTLIASNIIYDDIANQGYSIENIVVLRSSSFPATGYASDFETRNAPGGGGGASGTASPCADSPGCDDDPNDGVCYTKPDGMSSKCDHDICVTNSTEIILADSSYTVPSPTNPNLYSTRDNVLKQTKKGICL